MVGDMPYICRILPSAPDDNLDLGSMVVQDLHGLGGHQISLRTECRLKWNAQAARQRATVISEEI